MLLANCIYQSNKIKTCYQAIPHYSEGFDDLGHRLYAWRVPNGSWGEPSAGLVVGKGASLLIDTLWDLPDTQMMLSAMKPLTAAAPLTTAVNTHADGDPFWGNLALQIPSALPTIIRLNR